MDFASHHQLLSLGACTIFFSFPTFELLSGICPRSARQICAQNEMNVFNIAIILRGCWTTISYLRTRIIVLFRSMNTRTHIHGGSPTNTRHIYKCVLVSCSMDKCEIHCIWQFLQIDWFQWEFAETCCNCTNEMDCSIQGIYFYQAYSLFISPLLRSGACIGVDCQCSYCCTVILSFVSHFISFIHLTIITTA